MFDPPLLIDITYECYNVNNTRCNLDETLNRGYMYQCYTQYMLSVREPRVSLKWPDAFCNKPYNLK